MSSSRPIPSKQHGSSSDRISASFASSFRAASPSAQEIVAQDVEACYTEDDTLRGDDGSSSSSADAHGPTLYREPIGIAFGNRGPSMLPDPVDDLQQQPVLTRAERKQSRAAERSLLRDNHLLPPKHAPEPEPDFLTRTYKRLFSTKIPVSQEAEDGAIPRLEVSEVTPLLSSGGSDGTVHEYEDLDEQWEAAVASGKIQTTWKREAQTIAKYSRSLVVTFVLQYSISIASVFAVGHIGKVELGAVSLATMTANITCYAPFQGLATSLDTLCSQAYGSGHKQLVGLQCQRMIYFLFALMVPILVVWAFAADILVQLVPEAEPARLAGLYLRIAAAGIPGYILLECGKRFVNAQGLFHATTYVLLFAAPLNVLLSYLLVWHYNWGFIGAPIAVAFTQNLMPALLFLYIAFIDGSQCWGGFSKRALTNWGPMVKLALPGMIMVEAEWLAFEVLTIFSSQFGTSYLAAQSVLNTLTTSTFQLPFPISIAASTRIANLIGARLVPAARTSAHVAVGAACCVAVFNLVLLSSLRYQLPKLLTSDAEVIEVVARVMPIVGIMQLFDSMACMAHGLLRGIGRQQFGGYANLAAYYLIALPISFATGFGLDWKLEGLWTGVTLGLLLVAVVEYWYVFHVDWEQSVKEAENRNASG